MSCNLRAGHRAPYRYAHIGVIGGIGLARIFRGSSGVFCCHVKVWSVRFGRLSEPASTSFHWLKSICFCSRRYFSAMPIASSFVQVGALSSLRQRVPEPMQTTIRLLRHREFFHLRILEISYSPKRPRYALCINVIDRANGHAAMQKLIHRGSVVSTITADLR